MILYPIGLQSFQEIRSNGFIYVDKTEYIYRLFKTGKYYFLSRPRRFGKSLLLSTMRCFFEGKRDLFKGLFIDSCPDLDWEPYYVIHLDLNGENYSNQRALESRLDAQLKYHEQTLGIMDISLSYSERFRTIIRDAFIKTGRQVVVLIDEYEKPILDTILNPELQDVLRNLLSGFYAVLKSSDDYLRFCFLTGVTQLGQMNIFSGLNNLQDISLDINYAAICGITEEELITNFKEGIEEYASTKRIYFDEARTLLKSNFDGYHFAEVCPDIYNPFSLLHTLKSKSIGDYWFKSGTPKFLIDLIRNQKIEIEDLNGVVVDKRQLYGAYANQKTLVPLLYQTGYLTIKEYDEEYDEFTLGYPNAEVTYGFLKSLLPLYTGENEDFSYSEVISMLKELRSGDIDGYMKRLNSLFANYPYENIINVEKHFQGVIYIVSALLGLSVDIERHTSNGRIDMVIQTKEFIYLIEFKMDESPEVALCQIEEKGYARPFLSDPRKLIKVGVEFSSKDRCIARWEVAE